MLNLTQHLATPDQLADGVVNLGEHQRKQLSALLTFEDLPTADDIEQRAEAIALMAQHHQVDKAMIGGALWLMSPLIVHLNAKNIAPYFAFSKRMVIEETLSDGSTQKVAIFRHVGFIPASV